MFLLEISQKLKKLIFKYLLEIFVKFYQCNFPQIVSKDFLFFNNIYLNFTISTISYI